MFVLRLIDFYVNISVLCQGALCKAQGWISNFILTERLGLGKRYFIGKAA